MRMQRLDLLIAVTPQETRAAVLTLGSLIEDGDLPCRAVVLMHAGPRANFVDLDDFLSTSEVIDSENTVKPFEWMIAHSQSALTFSESVQKLGSMKMNSHAVLVKPGLTVEDKKWFGKIQQTFIKDARNMLTVVLPFKNISLPPVRSLPQLQVKGPMIMGGPDLANIFESCTTEANFARDLRFTSKALGGNRWTIESIRHVFNECQEQEKSDSAATLFE